MLTFKDCIKIGTFQKPYGFSGTLQLVFEPGLESSVEQAKMLITGTNGLPLPWFVTGEGVRITSSTTAQVDLEWINDPSSARKLCGSPVYILKSDSISIEPDPVFSDWEGFQLLDEKGILIGSVIRTENFSGNLVMIVDTATGEKMVPFHPDLVIKADPDKRTLWLELPEGLLEI